MSYKIERVIERNARGALKLETVMDATCEWMDDETLLEVAEADVFSMNMFGAFMVTQCGRNVESESHYFTVDQPDEFSTVSEVKAALEAEVARLSDTAQARWAGLSREDKNEMVIDVQRGATPAVAVAWLED